jgi:hypothetical protein
MLVSAALELLLACSLLLAAWGSGGRCSFVRAAPPSLLSALCASPVCAFCSLPRLPVCPCLADRRSKTGALLQAAVQSLQP